jgi:hypothetical protein
MQRRYLRRRAFLVLPGDGFPRGLAAFRRRIALRLKSPYFPNRPAM